jgi:glyoxylase-like metal-dependent hydrolase (beta-lactamase superfamily II)
MSDNLQWTVGDVTITRIVESDWTISVDQVLAVSDSEVMASHASWLEPHFVSDDGQLRMSIQALAIAVGDRKMIVDTCIGENQLEGTSVLGPQAPFLADLAASGFPREAVDTVICTHLHYDHVGWNTMQVDGEWVPTFPNARYVLCRDEWDHWRAEEDRGFAATLGNAVQPVIEAGLADLVLPDHEVTPEIRLASTPGHTPGHVAVRIESQGQRAFITGDLAHHPVQFGEPHWYSHADSDSDGSTATRHRVLDELADSDVLVIGTHFTAPTAGHLVRDGKGCRFEAVGAPRA